MAVLSNWLFLADDGKCHRRPQLQFAREIVGPPSRRSQTLVAKENRDKRDACPTWRAVPKLAPVASARRVRETRGRCGRNLRGFAHGGFDGGIRLPSERRAPVRPVDPRGPPQRRAE